MKTNSKSIEVSFELPGFDRKGIKVKVSKNSLSINAHKKAEFKVKKKDYFHHEKAEGTFAYSTTLPSVKPKKAKIEFKKGILKIKAPRE